MHIYFHRGIEGLLKVIEMILATIFKRKDLDAKFDLSDADEIANIQKEKLERQLMRSEIQTQEFVDMQVRIKFLRSQLDVLRSRRK